MKIEKQISIEREENLKRAKSGDASNPNKQSDGSYEGGAEEDGTQTQTAKNNRRTLRNRNI